MVAASEAVVVCRRCCGEVCSAISEAVDAAAGAAADSEEVALVVVEVVDLVAVLAEVGTLVVEVRAAVGKIIRLIREKFMVRT